MTGAIGNHQNITTKQSGYPTNGQTVLSLVPANMCIFLHTYSLYNGSGSNSDVGLGVSLASASWKFLRYVGGVALDSSIQLKNGTPTNLFNTTNGDGFLVEAKKTFGYLVFNVSQAGTGSPVFTYEYWNGAWTTLPMSQTPVYSATGYIYATFNPPVDWVPGDGGLTTNQYYSVRVRATTAPTLAVQASSLRVNYWFYYNQAMSTGSRNQALFKEHPFLMESGEALAPYFQVASSANTVEASYQAAP